jgi:hypothetical protein
MAGPAAIFNQRRMLRMRARMAIPLLVAAASLAVPAAASAVFNKYSVEGLTATFSAPTHTPNCKQLWPVRVTATFHGKRAHAVAYYQFLSNGSLVATVNPFSHTRRNPGNGHPYHFYGSFYDNTFGPFGALAVGHTLDVRAVVQVAGIRAYPGTWVRVRHVRGCPPK